MTAPQYQVGVIGASGRMGIEVSRAVTNAADMTVAAGIDLGDDMAALSAAGCTVLVDFTHPDVAMDHILFALTAGIDCVIGTSGFTSERIAEAQLLSDEHPDVGVMVVPNFAIGAVLATRFAGVAARFFQSAEIVELHHAAKADAPSGTAVAAAHVIAAGRSAGGLGAVPDATTHDPDGARGATVDGIHVHAVRMQGLVAHLEMLFGSTGETLTIRHDSFTRESFMPGVLAAIRAVGKRPGLTVGLEALLDD
ncbi:MAG: 4-hydroxy-tetrahydrodipicolinate reductase [Nakamurella sp.]